jgi:hypothetical protein
MRTYFRNALQKVGELMEPRVAGAAVVEPALSQQRELRAVVAEFVDLRVVELHGVDYARRTEQIPALLAQAAVSGQMRVGAKPS